MTITKLINPSIEYPFTWKENGLEFTEVIRQEYAENNCIIRAGFVDGDNKPQVDTVFLRLEKDGEEPTTILLRPDEMQIIAWVATGVILSHLRHEADRQTDSHNDKETDRCF